MTDEMKEHFKQAQAHLNKIALEIQQKASLREITRIQNFFHELHSFEQWCMNVTKNK